MIYFCQPVTSCWYVMTCDSAAWHHDDPTMFWRRDEADEEEDFAALLAALPVQWTIFPILVNTRTHWG